MPRSKKTEELTNPKTSALNVMAGRFNVEPAKLLSTLKNTVFKKATDDELLALVVVANEHGLNPLTKEIYAFPAQGGGITPVVSVDGWTRIMNSHPDFDGIQFVTEFDVDKGAPISCTATVHVKGRAHPIVVTEFASECVRNTPTWKQWPMRMLRHKALIQGARTAFGFSGIYDDDEAKEISKTNEPAKPVFGEVIDPVDDVPLLESDDAPPGAEPLFSQAEADEIEQAELLNTK